METTGTGTRRQVTGQAAVESGSPCRSAAAPLGKARRLCRRPRAAQIFFRLIVQRTAIGVGVVVFISPYSMPKA